TSDNRLIGYVRSCSAAVERSGEFRKAMEAAIASSPSTEDVAEPDASDLSGWMRYFGVAPEDDELDEE
ncbi:MAG TPA: hypothetical protein VFC63_10490, partial [Blastocatellia bacterium]|nr:hypothetical protein [Blastocatellia bacterium]